jgi:molybdate transport system substrate-binding protein
MRRRAGVFVVGLMVLAASCGSDEDGSTKITVLAATSLTGAFDEIERAFEAANPGVDVTMSFGGSSTLANQIANGAPADVFASADEKNMIAIADLLAGDYSFFTANSLAIMVAPGNPKNIRTLADLSRSDVVVITAQPDVPIRSYTDAVLERAGVVANFRSFEANVGGIVTKITSGAADAGIVYRTDVIAAGSKAQGVDIPADQNYVARYPIAVLESSANRTIADAFVEFVNGAGRSLLESYGFGER